MATAPETCPPPPQRPDGSCADAWKGSMMTDANPFALAEFRDNPERRCPVVLVLDTSASMQGEAIRQLNAGLQQLASDLQRDPLASLRVELAIVSFGGTVSTVDVRDGRGQSISADPVLAFV